MLHIIGGTYRKICHEPLWNELYGSGLRAVLALSDLSDGLTYSTFVGPDELEELQVKTDYARTQLHITQLPTTVRFAYNHPLAAPNIYPALERYFQHKHQFTTTAPNLLVYGILEGDSVVHGDHVVYDPQSPNNPKPFGHNGSTAQHLALVLNS
jgi:hypothetical protein